MHTLPTPPPSPMVLLVIIPFIKEQSGTLGKEEIVFNCGTHCRIPSDHWWSFSPPTLPIYAFTSTKYLVITIWPWAYCFGTNTILIDLVKAFGLEGRKGLGVTSWKKTKHFYRSILKNLLWSHLYVKAPMESWSRAVSLHKQDSVHGLRPTQEHNYYAFSLHSKI